jgi:flagellar assembly factor FliW
MIRLENTRFGTITLDPSAEIAFPRGLIGFASETRFALIERDRGAVSYLQSLITPGIALPVIDARMLQPTYPLGGSAELANAAGIPNADDMLALVVLAVDPQDRCLRANLLAPIVIDASSRKGAQVLLDSEKYGTSVPIADVPRRKPTNAAIVMPQNP